MNFHEYNAARAIPSSLKDKIIDFEGNPLTLLENLSKINIIVGANNSGKSYFLRELFKQPSEPIYLNKNHTKDFSDKIKEFVNLFYVIISGYASNDEDLKNPQFVLRSPSNNIPDFKFNDMNTWHGLSDTNDINFILKHLSNFTNSLMAQENQPLVLQKMTPNKMDENPISLPVAKNVELTNWVKEFKSLVHTWLQDFEYSKNKFDHIYIHHIRSIGKYSIDGDSLVKSISEAYSFKGHSSITTYDDPNPDQYFNAWVVETGLDLYYTFSNLYSSVKGRKLLSKFENFLSEQFFESKEMIIRVVATT